jgi:hypothetical protein
MRYFLDAEFNGFGGELVSIALVPEDDALPAFYEAIICKKPTVWVRENVQPVLDKHPLDRTQVSNRFSVSVSLTSMLGIMVACCCKPACGVRLDLP